MRLLVEQKFEKIRGSRQTGGDIYSQTAITAVAVAAMNVSAICLFFLHQWCIFVAAGEKGKEFKLGKEEREILAQQGCLCRSAN